jgi:hypothetical protein
MTKKTIYTIITIVSIIILTSIIVRNNDFKTYQESENINLDNTYAETGDFKNYSNKVKLTTEIVKSGTGFVIAKNDTEIKNTTNIENENVIENDEIKTNITFFRSLIGKSKSDVDIVLEKKYGRILNISENSKPTLSNKAVYQFETGDNLDIWYNSEGILVAIEPNFTLIDRFDTEKQEITREEVQIITGEEKNKIIEHLAKQEPALEIYDRTSSKITMQYYDKLGIAIKNGGILIVNPEYMNDEALLDFANQSRPLLGVFIRYPDKKFNLIPNSIP